MLDKMSYTGLYSIACDIRNTLCLNTFEETTLMENLNSGIDLLQKELGLDFIYTTVFNLTSHNVGPDIHLSVDIHFPGKRGYTTVKFIKTPDDFKLNGSLESHGFNMFDAVQLSLI